MWWCCFAISHSGTMGEIVPWREGFHSGQPSFRTTPRWQPHNWAPCFFVGCRTSMDCMGVSCWGRRMPQNRAPHSARHSWLPQNCSTLGTHTLSEVQKWQRYAIAQDLLNRYQREEDGFLGRIVTLDETWARSYEPHLKRQSNEWKHPGSPRPKKVRPTQSNVKAMFIVAYDIDGVILHHTVPQRQTVNAAYYCSFLRNHLRPAVRRKRQHLLATNPIILHDNARAYTANVVTYLLRRWRWEILEQRPYSPGMSPCDYDLFAKMKEPLRGIRYNTREAIIRAVGRSLLDINRSGRADGVRLLPQIWQKVVHMGGRLFWRNVNVFTSGNKVISEL